MFRDLDSMIENLTLNEKLMDDEVIKCKEQNVTDDFVVEQEIEEANKELDMLMKNEIPNLTEKLNSEISERGGS
jgi:hypothetical protein